jgi:hypothetical protein
MLNLEVGEDHIRDIPDHMIYYIYSIKQAPCNTRQRRMPRNTNITNHAEESCRRNEWLLLKKKD